MNDRPVQEFPVEVTVKNWSDLYVKPRLVGKTTMQTYIIDPASANGKTVQISDYEPSRVRMVVQALDQPVIITTDVPRGPEVSVAAGPPNQGRVIPVSTDDGCEFFGPDAFWLNAVSGSTTTRVSVTKEYAS